MSLYCPPNWVRESGIKEIREAVASIVQLSPDETFKAFKKANGIYLAVFGPDPDIIKVINIGSIRLPHNKYWSFHGQPSPRNRNCCKKESVCTPDADRTE
jgi:hypothetical protein